MRSMLPACHLVSLCALALLVGTAPAAELAQWTFPDGPEGWTPTNQAFVSDLARRVLEAAADPVG